MCKGVKIKINVITLIKLVKNYQIILYVNLVIINVYQMILLVFIIWLKKIIIV
jgi:hypothetical protein